MEGWIKIHRRIVNHWIFKDSDKFRSWIIILLTVNHEQKKVLLGEKLFTCNRGESLNSLDTWAKLFGKNWNKSKVRRFFELLKNDSMIVLTNEQKTTRLTVCNYDSYQDKRNDSETKVKRDRNGSETSLTPNKNDKNDKNEEEGKELAERSINVLNAFKENVLNESKELGFDKSIYIPFLEHWTKRDFESGKYAWQVPETFIIPSRLKGWKNNNKADRKTEKNLWT